MSCLYLILGNFHDVLVTYLHLSEKESCVFVDAHLFGSHSMDVQQNNNYYVLFLVKTDGPVFP